MNLKTRLKRFECRTGPDWTRYDWLNAGETKEADLARLGRSSHRTESEVFICWESENYVHGHFALSYPTL